MYLKKIKNSAQSTIAGGLNNTTSPITVSVASTEGSRFTQPGSPFYAIKWTGPVGSDPSNAPDMEVVLVTDRNTDLVTFYRGQLETFAKPSAGAVNFAELIPEVLDNQASGGSVFSTQMAVAVDTTARVLLATNTARKGLFVVNNGATDCYIGNDDVVSGSTAAANGGLLLKSGGGALSMDAVGTYTGPLRAITNAGSTVVSVVEW